MSKMHEMSRQARHDRKEARFFAMLRMRHPTRKVLIIERTYGKIRLGYHTKQKNCSDLRDFQLFYWRLNSQRTKKNFRTQLQA